LSVCGNFSFADETPLPNTSTLEYIKPEDLWLFYKAENYVLPSRDYWNKFPENPKIPSDILHIQQF